jgi:hypothetical protein
MKKENQALVEAASTLTRSLACDGLVLAADVIEDCAALRAIGGEQKVILVQGIRFPRWRLHHSGRRDH